MGACGVLVCGLERREREREGEGSSLFLIAGLRDAQQGRGCANRYGAAREVELEVVSSGSVIGAGDRSIDQHPRRPKRLLPASGDFCPRPPTPTSPTALFSFCALTSPRPQNHNKLTAHARGRSHSLQSRAPAPLHC